MSELDKEVVMELYDLMHKTVGRFINKDYLDEAHEAVILLTSTMIQTKCLYYKANVEHTLEDSFDSIADYTYGMIDDEVEEG